jgi:hypothetical protein
MLSCGFWRRVVLEVDTEVSKNYVASVFRFEMIRAGIWLQDDDESNYSESGGGGDFLA